MLTQWVFFTALSLITSSSTANQPDWAKKETQTIEGSTLRLVCNGTGPSIDIARTEALNSCRSSARQQLITDVHVRSFSIQTEKSSAFHEEVLESSKVTGLKCIPDHEQVDEQDSAYTVWIRCKFNLKQVRVEPAQIGTKIELPNQSAPDSGIRNNAQLNQVKASLSNDKMGVTVTGRSSSLSIASVPVCESVIIRGQKPRTVNCAQNPITVNLMDGDTEIVVRAKGYVPKTVLLKSERRPYEVIQVILDPL